jgi:prepilin-type processing-associated H-X9-DG protein
MLFKPGTDEPVSFATVYPGLTDTDPLWKRISIADWICWKRRGPDRYWPSQSNSVPSFNITQSGLAPYMNIKRLEHATDAEAWDIGGQANEMFRCPSDRLEAHFKNAADNSHGSYGYSYSMNRLFTNPVSGGGVRFGGTKFNGRITSIKNPGEKVLIVCEDEKTVNDGSFSPDSTKMLTGQVCDLVASRHENKVKKAASKYASDNKNEDARGNVGFADGHAEFFGRKDALRQRYSGNPNPDPPTF